MATNTKSLCLGIGYFGAKHNQSQFISNLYSKDFNGYIEPFGGTYKNFINGDLTCKAIYKNDGLIAYYNKDGQEILAKEYEAETARKNLENEKQELIEKTKNGDLDALRSLAVKYPDMRITEFVGNPKASEILFKIENFNNGNFTGEAEILLWDEYKLLINDILKKEYSGLFFTNYFKEHQTNSVYAFKLKFRKVNGKFKEIIVLDGDNLIWGLFYNQGYIPQFQINIPRRNTRLGFLYKNGIKPETGCYIENSGQDFEDGLNKLLKEGKRDLAFEFCILSMFYEEKVKGRMDGINTTNRTAHLALEQNNNAALELALDRLTVSCEKEVLLGCLYKGLILWKLQRYDEAITCFQAKKDQKFSAGNYGETTPFLTEVLNEIKSLKDQNIIFPDEKELKKRIKDIK